MAEGVLGREAEELRAGVHLGRHASNPGGHLCTEETVSPAMDQWFVQVNTRVTLNRSWVQVAIY